jgi:hypothetical protein
MHVHGVGQTARIQKEKSMPRRKLSRRFEPSYGVSMMAVEEEAKALNRQVENMEVHSASDVEAKVNAIRKKSRQCWDHLCLLTDDLADRDRQIIYTLLFRDFYHILELYHFHVRTKHPGTAAPSPPPLKSKKPSASEFSEWLFDPQPKGDSHASSNT